MKYIIQSAWFRVVDWYGETEQRAKDSVQIRASRVRKLDTGDPEDANLAENLRVAQLIIRAYRLGVPIPWEIDPEWGRGLAPGERQELARRTRVELQRAVHKAQLERWESYSKIVLPILALLVALASTTTTCATSCRRPSSKPLDVRVHQVAP